MGVSALRDTSKKARTSDINIDLQYGLNSANNFIFYGSTNGKSTLALTQLDESAEPILVVSAAGASIYLRERYPTAVFRTASTLAELEVIIKDLEENYKLLRNIQQILEDPTKIKMFYEKVFVATFYKDAPPDIAKDDFSFLLELAKSNKFIFSRVVLEECDVISQLIQDKVEGFFNVEYMGETKASRGLDWNVLSHELVGFYSRWLRLPCITILATADKMPGEKENLKTIIPALCTGSAQRLLISTIGNVLYVGSDDAGYFVQVKPDNKALVRSKFYTLKTDYTQIPSRVDVTNKPEAFWQFIKDCENGVYNLAN